MRIRQLAMVARELDPIVDDLCAVFGVETCYNDPSVGEFGLHNALMPFNNRFLEVVAPVRQGTTAGRLLEKRGGDGGYMVIVQVEDHAAQRKHVEDLGAKIVWEVTLPEAATFHLHPKDLGAILSFDVADPPESWLWAGPWEDKIRTDIVQDFAGVEIQSHDPKMTAERWGQLVQRPATEAGPGRYEIDLSGDVVRFIKAADGRGPGMSGIDVRVNDRDHILATARARNLPIHADRITIGGTHFRLAD